jgi:phospholipid transport system substrate-binding protein
MGTTSIQIDAESRLSRRLREVGTLAVRLAVAWLVSAMLMALVASAAEFLPVAPPSRKTDAQNFIIAKSDELLTVVSRERDAIRRDPSQAYTIVHDIIGRHVDIEWISRRVLGRYWRTATPEQRERFKTAFLNKLVQTFAAGVSRQVSVLDNERTKITYLSSALSNDGRKVTVRTRLGSADAHPLRVDYKLHRVDDTWRLIDIVIDGASLVLTYRSSYAAQIERTGIDELIERIRSETPGAYRVLNVMGRSVAEGS